MGLTYLHRSCLTRHRFFSPNLFEIPCVSSTDFADYTDYSNHLKGDAKSVGFNSPQLAAIEKIKHLF